MKILSQERSGHDVSGQSVKIKGVPKKNGNTYILYTPVYTMYTMIVSGMC